MDSRCMLPGVPSHAEGRPGMLALLSPRSSSRHLFGCIRVWGAPGGQSDIGRLLCKCEEASFFLSRPGRCSSKVLAPDGKRSSFDSGTWVHSSLDAGSSILFFRLLMQLRSRLCRRRAECAMGGWAHTWKDALHRLAYDVLSAS